MYHLKVVSPSSYWRKLHQILHSEVASLYRQGDDYFKPVVLTSDEFHSASMILNNVRLVPKDFEMELPEPNQEHMYNTWFEPSWEDHMPNLVIGYPEIKTCANHRLEVLMDNYDFVAWKSSDLPPITLMTHNLPLDAEILDFFKALGLFQRTLGSNSLGIFDYCVEGKIIKLSRRYVASREEYVEYWKQTVELNKQLIVNRQKKFRCIWCFQTFMGLTAQGMSKGLIYDRPDHIPKAMQDLILMMSWVGVPLYYITKTICEHLGNPQPKDALTCYNNLIDSLVSEKKLLVDSPNFATGYECALYQKDVELLNKAIQSFRLDFAMVNSFGDVDQRFSFDDQSLSGAISQDVCQEDETFPDILKSEELEDNPLARDEKMNRLPQVASAAWSDASDDAVAVDLQAVLTSEGRLAKRTDADPQNRVTAALSDFVLKETARNIRKGRRADRKTQRYVKKKQTNKIDFGPIGSHCRFCSLLTHETQSVAKVWTPRKNRLVLTAEQK